MSHVSPRSLFEEYGRRCFYCEQKTKTFKGRNRRPTVDHFWPRSKGGRNARSNYVLACLKCNNVSKNNRLPTIAEFYKLLDLRPNTNVEDLFQTKI